MGAKSLRKQTCLGLYLPKQSSTHWLLKASLAISYDYTNLFRYA